MPSSADDPVATALRDAATAALAQVSAASSSPTAPVVLIDGRSGSGKTTLAALIAADWPSPVRVVALDDIYPGWDGLAQGAETAREEILAPHRAGRPARWRRWDWSAQRQGESDAVGPGTGLIVEGSGVLTPASAALADVRIWLESPAGSRRERALRRDGDTYRPHWERWAAQEDIHLARDHPRHWATLVAEIP
ncbi:hypothetical protein [Microbacterium sp. CH-015]|uniref:hypothetical protein n=1 Tax=Microbacterium sp. CH-015 TaxID=3406734 RepID=UPI003C76CBFC